MKKVFLTTVMSLMMCMGVFAQTQPDYMKAPKPKERVLGTITYNNKRRSGNGGPWSNQEVYALLLKKAKSEYPDKAIDIREMVNTTRTESIYPCYNSSDLEHAITCYDYYCDVVGKVVWVMSNDDQIAEFNGNLSQALNKALRNVREGSRLAIDQVSVPYSMEKETLKDQLLDLLLDKGYKVIAKDYLDKLYEEQQAQQSGIYNDNTTVQDNNFSAVGYYINVKVTETSLRVQVVNVSTGEYEGNATVNF